VGFRAESRVWTLDGCALGRVSAPSLRVTRTKTLIRRTPIDHWVLTLGRDVTTAISTRDTTIEAPAGVPFVLSLADELVSERGADERLQLYLARDSFPELAPVLDAARGMVLDTAMGQLLGNYMRLLEQSLPDLRAEDLSRLRSAIGAMVAACVVPSADRLAAASGQIDLSRLERVRRAVARYLRSPSLGPSLLCRHVGMSRSQLYRLMEGDGGVARYIQRQRLSAAYAILCVPSNSTPIAEIAEELCFADASGFSRAFRHEFGMTPSDVRAASRAASRAGFASAIVPKDRANAPTPAGLSDCLRVF
jgi:AraC-like DNA-binding protein